MVHERESKEEFGEEELHIDYLVMVPSQMKDGQHEVQDLLEEFNLGELEDPKVVYVGSLLDEDFKQRVILVLK